MVHDRIEKEREKQLLRREQTSIAGKKSAAARVVNSNGTKTKNKRSTNVQRNVNPSSSSSDEDGDTQEDNNRRIFQVPTFDEVEIYIDENAPEVNPEVFYRFYESKGWMVGKNKMKNWKSAVATWKAKAPKKVNRFPKGDEAERIFREQMNT
jgi:hypothetical protein